MSGLSSRTYSCGGEAGRFRGGGDGERCLKNVKMVPLDFFLFFFCGAAFVGATSTGISSSVDGGEEREESESAMVGLGGNGACCDCGCGCKVTTTGARLSTYEVISLFASPDIN